MGPKWEKAGVCGVDSGLIWIGDPCYCVTPDAGDHPAQTWSEFCKRADLKHQHTEGFSQWNYNNRTKGLGVCITVDNDGIYAVYVKKKKGIVTEAKIVFEEIPEDEL